MSEVQVRTWRWSVFASQSFVDLRLWLYILVLHLLWHGVFFVVIWSDVQITPNSSELFLSALSAFRWDLKPTSVFVFLFWIFITTPLVVLRYEHCLHRIRKYYLSFVWSILCFVNLAQIGYFGEYKTTFDFHLFALVYDDVQAIMRTIYDEYNLLAYIAVLVVLVIIGVRLLHVLFDRWTNKAMPQLFSHHFIIRQIQGTGLVMVMVLFFILTQRGSLTDVPFQYRHTDVTRDEIINRATLDPISAMYEAFTLHQKTLGIEGIQKYTDKSITDVLQSRFPDKSGNTLDDYIIHSASGNTHAVRHIFLLVMESYSSWPLLKKYQQLGLTTGMQRLANSNKGHLFANFLPSSTGTMTSFASMITGMQEVSVFTNYQPQSTRQYPTSMPGQMSALGYKTRFFYGGSGSYQDISNFLGNQGVAEVYTGVNISTSNTDLAVWGVPDDELFDYVQRNMDDSTPSFNIILSVSFHPPYNLNLQQWGIDSVALGKVINAQYQSPVDATIFGHWKYADEQMYRFIVEMEKKLPDSLFVVTGDHYARNKHVLTNPPLYETEAVPLLLYGNALAGVDVDTTQPGTHLDITPTIIELVAPSGFRYYSLGQNMLDRKRSYATSSQIVISRKYIGQVNALPLAYRLPDNQPIELDKATVKEIQHTYSFLGAFSWWRIIHGATPHPELAQR